MASIRRNISAISLALILISFSAHAENSFNTLVELEFVNSVFYTTVAVNGITEEFMLDTGAGKTLINKEMFDMLSQLGDLTPIRVMHFRQADGTVVEGMLYRVEVVSVGECDLPGAFVAHAPAIDKNLLGINTLEMLSPFVVDTWRSHILLSNCE